MGLASLELYLFEYTARYELRHVVPRNGGDMLPVYISQQALFPLPNATPMWAAELTVPTPVLFRVSIVSSVYPGSSMGLLAANDVFWAWKRSRQRGCSAYSGS